MMKKLKQLCAKLESLHPDIIAVQYDLITDTTEVTFYKNGYSDTWVIEEFEEGSETKNVLIEIDTIIRKRLK